MIASVGDLEAEGMGEVTYAAERNPWPTAAAETATALEHQLRERLTRLRATVERLAEDQSVVAGAAEAAPAIAQLGSSLAGLERLVAGLSGRADRSARGPDHIPVRRAHEDSAR
jgi:hypothetical protein